MRFFLGFRLTKQGDGVIIDVENVKDPRKKGDRLEGEWVMETRCGLFTTIQVLVFKEGRARTPLDPRFFDCFNESRFPTPVGSLTPASGQRQLTFAMRWDF